MHDCHAYLDLHRDTAMEGKFYTERDPRDELGSFVALYLPELKLKALVFSRAFLAQKQSANFLRREIMGAGLDSKARDRAFEKYQSNWEQQYADLNSASDALTAAARELLVKIMGLSERDDASPMQQGGSRKGTGRQPAGWREMTWRERIRWLRTRD
jgi:hypothetical protein